MKNNLGVTMIELVVVLVIIIIIATVAVTSGTKTLDEADIAEVYIEMDSMKETINAVILQKSMNEDLRLEQGKHYDADFVPAEGVTYGDNVLGYQDDWHIIFGVDEKDIYLESQVRDTLGLDSINHTYIVNYETAEIELYKPIIVADTMVRTYEQVRSVAE